MSFYIFIGVHTQYTCVYMCICINTYNVLINTIYYIISLENIMYIDTNRKKTQGKGL